ncbi:hypothetical protein SAMN05892877_11081 [Rhizobium subbaraonis]|uniref:Uncharacterized protein n=1 Tax=Rhizobium subbaraonis TaxID=908946 RepID=A0A285UL58_9HYPH|nr:hypothetical protein [Rhizobium subbaraonis]SOC42589.1 hypothetical protein SAMN05892877_11081 [Rhizobium subbaraonis]
MAEIDGTLIYEMLKRIQTDIGTLKDGQRDLRQDNLSLRNQIHTLQGDVNNLRGSVAHIEDRIENRLELRELGEAQAKFEPHP